MVSFVLKVVLVMAFLWTYTSALNFDRDVWKTFGNGYVHTQNNGNDLSLSMKRNSRSGVESYNSYLFGTFEMQMKLVPGNSAGTVTTFYLRSNKKYKHDEIDFEFLGNSSKQTYTLSTNIFTQGNGNREKQFRLWFDPTKHFHNYTILWSKQRIMLMVDNIPIRVFENYMMTKYKIPFPTSQWMNMQASLWDADGWATQGGRVKTDWSKAPFTAYFRNLKINSNDPQTPELNLKEKEKLIALQQKYMTYNYCVDKERFRKIGGLPKECGLKMF